MLAVLTGKLDSTIINEGQMLNLAEHGKIED